MSRAHEVGDSVLIMSESQYCAIARSARSVFLPFGILGFHFRFTPGFMLSPATRVLAESINPYFLAKTGRRARPPDSSCRVASV